jgi:hypothetical protein
MNVSAHNTPTDLADRPNLSSEFEEAIIITKKTSWLVENIIALELDASGHA